MQGESQSLEELAARSEKPADLSPPAFEGVTVRLATDVRHEVVPDRNVLAMIEGSDPILKNEYIVIGCHHDHDGAEGGRILNGADDNGSGTVGLLEIAEAYAVAAEAGKRPARSVIFAAFNSEERGLLGAYAFVERPPVPLEKVVGVLNMDMIGRDEEVPEGGGRRFRGLPVQTAESNRDAFHLMGYSRTGSLAGVDVSRRRTGGSGFGSRKPWITMCRTSCGGATSGRSSRRGCRRSSSTRGCTRTTTRPTTGRRRSGTTRWSGSPGWSISRAGTWRRSRAGRPSTARPPATGASARPAAPGSGGR
ncbi:MAG: M28 family peptidase [Isosphaeraceae bacterium]